MQLFPLQSHVGLMNMVVVVVDDVDVVGLIVVVAVVGVVVNSSEVNEV